MGDLQQLSDIYMQIGAVGFFIVCFMSMFMYMLYKQMKTLDKIYIVLYEEKSNNLTLQSANDIIESQYKLTKYNIIENLMSIYYENNIKNKDRQELIRKNLKAFYNNLHSRNLSILSRLKYKGVKLSVHLESESYSDVADVVFNNMCNNYKPIDLISVLDNHFNKHINEATNMVDMLSQK